MNYQNRKEMKYMKHNNRKANICWDNNF